MRHSLCANGDGGHRSTCFPPFFSHMTSIFLVRFHNISFGRRRPSAHGRTSHTCESRKTGTAGNPRSLPPPCRFGNVGINSDAETRQIFSPARISKFLAKKGPRRSFVQFHFGIVVVAVAVDLRCCYLLHRAILLQRTEQMPLKIGCRKINALPPSEIHSETAKLSPQRIQFFLQVIT